MPPERPLAADSDVSPASPVSPGVLGSPKSYVTAPLLKAGAPAEHWVPPQPKHNTPRAGERAVGLLGDAFPGKPLLQRLNWIHVPLLLGTPIIAVVGCAYWTYDWRTLAFAVAYYFFSGLGITAGAWAGVVGGSCGGAGARSPGDERAAAPRQQGASPVVLRPPPPPPPPQRARLTSPLAPHPATSPTPPPGYHRYFAHRAFKATPAFEVLLMLMGTAAVEGSVKWWARGHRAHHKYVDTDKDPYAIIKGFWYAHIGWMLAKADKEREGHVYYGDLKQNPVLAWQNKYYLPLALFMVRAWAESPLRARSLACTLPLTTPHPTHTPPPHTCSPSSSPRSFAGCCGATTMGATLWWAWRGWCLCTTPPFASTAWRTGRGRRPTLTATLRATASSLRW